MWGKQKIYKILRWSERYTKTDMVYLAKGGFWLGLNYVVSMLAALILMIAFANLLEPEIYGLYKYVLATAGMIGALSLTGVGAAVVRSISRGFKRSFTHGHRIQLKWSLIPIVIGLCFSGYYFLEQNYVLGFSFLVIGVLLPISANLSLYDSYYLGARKFGTVARFNIIQQLVQAAILVATLLLTNDILVLVSVYVLSLVVPNGIFYILAKRSEGSRVDDEAIDPTLASDSKHLSLMKVVARFAAELDKFLIFHFLGAVQLAVYSLAFTPVAKIGGLSVVIKRLGLPKLSVIPIPILKKTLDRKLYLVFGLSTLLALLYVLLAPSLFKMAFPRYLESVPVTQVLALMLIFTMPATLLHQVMVAHMKKRDLYVSQIIQPVVKILLISILIPVFGIWGGVAALTLAQMIYFFILLFLFKKL